MITSKVLRTTSASAKVAFLPGIGVLMSVALAAQQGFTVLLAAALVALVLAWVMPMSVTVLSVAWVLLVRPNTKLLETTVGGFSVSEVDLLILLALIACSRIQRSIGTQRVRSRLSDWAPLLAWPTWLLARAVLPQIGGVFFASPLVDLRILSSYLVLIPLWVIASRRGGEALLMLISYSAYAACAIAVGAWSMTKLGLLGPGSYALVNIASGAAQDVRPGGEVLIPVLALLLAFNKAPLALGSRWVSVGLLAGEILVSQTLSILVATVAGIAVALLFNWRNVSPMKKILVVSLLAASAYLALPGSKASPAADADVYSRFNLSQRLEQNSAQYRVSEAATLATVYDDNPLVLLIGTGPGSLVTFNDGLVNEVKDLTHNVYNNIILKTGLLGAVLFVGGLLVAVRSQILNPGVLGRCLIGSMASIAVVSTTVPFVSTVMGLTALLALVTLAVWIAVDERGKRVGGNASE